MSEALKLWNLTYYILQPKNIFYSKNAAFL